MIIKDILIDLEYKYGVPEELVEELREKIEETDSYWDDDWIGDEEKSDGVYESEEIIPFEMSSKAFSLLIESKSLQEIFSDCTLYFYGYKANDPKEYVLSISHSKCKYPFNNAILHGIDSGRVTRFEIVSNNDLFCYMGGGVGFNFDHPMRMSNLELCTENLTTISEFSINFPELPLINKYGEKNDK